MPDFMAKLHKIRFPWGLRPRPRCGSIQRSPDLLAVIKGPTSKGRNGKRGGKEKKGRVGQEKGEARPPKYLGLEPPVVAGNQTAV